MQGVTAKMASHQQLFTLVDLVQQRKDNKGKSENEVSCLPSFISNWKQNSNHSARL